MINLICGCICFACGIISYLDGNSTGMIVGMSSAILNFALAMQSRH